MNIIQDVTDKDLKHSLQWKRTSNPPETYTRVRNMYKPCA